MKGSKITGLLLLAALTSVHPSVAKDKVHGNKGVESGKEAPRGAEVKGEPASRDAAALKVKFSISEDERRIIRTYVEGYTGPGRGKKPKTLPPGLAKKVARGEQLPPGWQKKCVPGEIMPIEVYEKCHPLPPELVVKLPAAPEPTITVTIGGQIVRLIKATREILDVFNVHSR